MALAQHPTPSAWPTHWEEVTPPRPPVVASPTAGEPAPRHRPSTLAPVVAGATLLGGVGAAVLAESQNSRVFLVAAWVLLAIAVAATAVVAVQRLHQLLARLAAIGAVAVLAVGVLVPATARTGSCVIEAGGDLASCDLAGRALGGADLVEADLSGATLAGAVLAGADLTRADLAGANLTGADLTGATLDDANLSYTDLTDAVLAQAHAERGEFTMATVAGTDFHGAYLVAAQLGGLDLTAASLTGTTLTDAALTNAVLAGMDLAGADLSGVDLAEADLHDANLAGATLARTLLGNADFSGADLTGAVLLDVSGAGSASFAGAVLDGADLTGISLSGVDGGGANLAGAQLRGTILNSAQLDRADFTGAVLDSADLSGATLTGARLDGASMVGTNLALNDFSMASGLTDDMLLAALGVPGDQLAAQMSARQIRLESYDAVVAAVTGVRDGAGVAGVHAYDGSGAFHPAVFLGPSGTQTPAWATGVQQGWAPAGIRFAELVVVERAQVRETLQVCEYTSGGVPAPPITRYRLSTTVQILAASDGHVVAERAFAGTNPRACGANEPYWLAELVGDAPNLTAEAVPWVQGYVHPPA